MQLIQIVRYFLFTRVVGEKRYKQRQLLPTSIPRINRHRSLHAMSPNLTHYRSIIYPPGSWLGWNRTFLTSGKKNRKWRSLTGPRPARQANYRSWPPVCKYSQPSGQKNPDVDSLLFSNTNGQCLCQKTKQVTIKEREPINIFQARLINGD